MPFNMEMANHPSAEIEKGRQLAALSYLWIFSLIILIAKRDNPFVAWHARQGVILFVFSILLWPLPITRYAEFLILALMVLGFMQAAMGNQYGIPVISELAQGRLTGRHLHRFWHITKHSVIHLFKPEHVIPVFQEQRELILKSEEKSVKQEEPKFLALIDRVEKDEKKLQSLETEVHNLESKLTAAPR